MLVSLHLSSKPLPKGNPDLASLGSVQEAKLREHRLSERAGGLEASDGQQRPGTPKAARPASSRAPRGPSPSPAQPSPDLGRRTGVEEGVSTNGGVTQGIPTFYPSPGVQSPVWMPRSRRRTGRLLPVSRGLIQPPRLGSWTRFCVCTFVSFPLASVGRAVGPLASRSPAPSLHPQPSLPGAPFPLSSRV